RASASHHDLHLSTVNTRRTGKITYIRGRGEQPTPPFTQGLYRWAFGTFFAPAVVTPVRVRRKPFSPIKKNEVSFFAHRSRNYLLARTFSSFSSAARRHRRAVM